MRRPAGWTNEALLEEALGGPWKVPSPAADTRTIERIGWRQRITPSLRQGGLNEVAFAQMSDAEADAIIDRTIAEYADAGIRFRWAVTPGSTPHDLADRLAARGFARVNVRAMARDLSPIAHSLPPGSRVERVDHATVGEYTEVMAEGWSMDAGPLLPLHRGMLERGGVYRLFLAREGHAAVGVAAYSVTPRAAYQMGAVVLPAFRGRGHYAALVAARLAESAAEGLEIATSQAREETSAPILEKLGFVTVATFPIFTSPEP